MKKLGLLLSVMILFSCNDTKDKELQLKEKELELKEKQLRLDSIKAVADKTEEEPEKKDSVYDIENIKNKESKAIGKNKYCNARFDFCIDYPSNFKGLGESQNGDGQKFISDDKVAEITAFGNLEIEDVNDLESRYKNYLSSKKVTYKVFKDNYFVISGTESNQSIFYTKVLKKKIDYFGSETDVIQTLTITYPKSQNNIYSVYCKYIAKNFN